MTRGPVRVPPGGAGEDRDSGMSLVEVLVGIGLFGVLGAVLLAVTLSTARVTDDTRELTNVNEESRLAVERLGRELRQANEVVAVHLPATSTDTTALTFWTDFNGNGTKDLDAADPEVLTYRWDPVSGGLTLTANDPSGTAITRPLLSANVSAFGIGLRSSQWQYDTDGNGTTWNELDAAGPPAGNRNGVPDGPELARIDLVDITMTVLDGPHAQTYTTQVDLRNRNLN
jgi:type II secretory pathway pseudopilin PulG